MKAGVISQRARVLLKTLVEQHIKDGQPVGSGTLLKAAGLPVSAATIRNVMSDLEERGYLHHRTRRQGVSQLPSVTASLSILCYRFNLWETRQ